jgi:iduronate 2-sulfatase
MYARFLLALILVPWDLSPAAPRPNVLFIAVDDLNDYVGCLGGHPNAKTPNIDRLAASGTLFTNAHCQAPICGPSRASLMTGLRPSTSGIYGQIQDQNIRGASPATAKATFLPDYLEAHGYRSFGCGKIYHKGDNAKTFDEFGHGSDMGPKPKKRFNYDPADHPDRVGTTQTDWAPYPKADAQMPDYKTAEWVRRKILTLSAEVASERKPFFLAAGFCRPHVPLYVPKPWFDQHPIKGIKTPPYKADDWDDLPEISKRVNVAPMMPAMDWVLKEGHWPAILQAYLASTTFADHQVGRVLQMLEASPFADSTYIVLWSDHGYHLGEKGRFAKQSLWERSSRVPLIIAGPGLAKGQKCSAPVQLLDIYPTLVELLKLTTNRQNEGHSLVPLLKKPAADWPHFAITTYGPKNHAIQTRHHRYIQYEDGAAELYDHRSDPAEWKNIAAEAEQQKLIENLKRQLPRHNAPNAKGSSYNFNEYFKQALR